jgi:hypothetical protein
MAIQGRRGLWQYPGGGQVDEESAHRYRAGEPITDLCRACKALRGHTVIAADTSGHSLRVICNFCGSQHDYRGGEGRGGEGGAGVSRSPVRTGAEGDAFPLASERERTGAVMSSAGADDLELMLRRVLRQELGLTAVVPADKWRGGEMVLRPGKPGVQEKKWPIETFFHKVVMIRNRLRTLEQQLNAADLPEDLKVKLQSYVTGCYGTLTSFNVLFADEDDHFRGGGGDVVGS